MNVSLTLVAGAGVKQTITVSSGNTLYFRNYGTCYVICGQNNDGLTIYVYNSLTGKPGWQVDPADHRGLPGQRQLARPVRGRPVGRRSGSTRRKGAVVALVLAVAGVFGLIIGLLPQRGDLSRTAA